MKVIHYVKRFSVLTETFIYDQITRVDNRVGASFVVTEQRLNVKERPFHSVAEIGLKHLFSSYIDSRLAYKFNFLPWFLKQADWQRFFDEKKPDIVHCHAGNAARTFFHVDKKIDTSPAIIVSLHGSDVTWEPHVRAGYKKDMCQLAAKSNVIFTVPSFFLQRKAIENLGIPKEKIFVVRNGVNPAFCSEKLTPSNDNNIICIGRLIDCKGQQYLLDAFAKTLKHVQDAKLTLVGEGPNKPALLEQAQQLGISDAVTFIDRINHEDLPNFLATQHVYVQPSIKDPKTQQEESFGVAALEAGAVGLKIIVSNCGGLPEAIENLTGFKKVVTPCDVDGLSNSLIEALKQPNQKCDINYADSQECNTDNILALYKKLSKQ